MIQVAAGYSRLWLKSLEYGPRHLQFIFEGYAAVQFRTYWFQRISCALQRMHATSFNRNLAISRNEIKPGSLVYESMGYAIIMQERLTDSLLYCFGAGR